MRTEMKVASKLISFEVFYPKFLTSSVLASLFSTDHRPVIPRFALGMQACWHTHIQTYSQVKGEMQIHFQLKQSKRSGIFSRCFIFLTTMFKNWSYKLKTFVFAAARTSSFLRIVLTPKNFYPKRRYIKRLFNLYKVLECSSLFLYYAVSFRKPMIFYFTTRICPPPPQEAKECGCMWP